MSEREAPSGWRKSSFSMQGDCVEWRFADGHVYVRHSNSPGKAPVRYTYSEWEAFILGVKAGEADLDAGRSASAID